VAHIEELRSAYKLLVGNTKETRPSGRPRRRMGDNIKTVLQGIA
jgi:hypothetical protein